MRRTTDTAGAVRATLLAASILLPASAVASAPTEPLEIELPFVVDEWIDVGLGDDGWWLQRALLSEEERAVHQLEGSQEEARGYMVEIEHLIDLDEPWLGEIEIEWRDGDGRRIGSQTSRVLLDPETPTESLRVWLLGADYGWLHTAGLVLRMRADDEVPRLLEGDSLPLDSSFEEALATLDPRLFGVEEWRNFECGFGLPPLCQECVDNGLQCYEVDIAVTGSGSLAQPYCSTPESAAVDALFTCRRYAIGVGFFCSRPGYRPAEIRHSCDYPHSRYPYRPGD